MKSIRRLSDDLKNVAGGQLAIGTTHAQARYVLPEVIRQFRENFPRCGCTCTRAPPSRSRR